MRWPFKRREREPADLRTARLRLVAITPAMLAADGAADGSLGALLGARLTAEWPPEHFEPHVLQFIAQQFAAQPETLGWHRYVLLPDATGATLIGAIGGFPKPDGDVEIGYSTLPGFQRRGYGAEGVGALVEYLLGREGVASVSAQTFPRIPESIKIMERCGLRFVGPGDEEGAVRYRRMR